MKEFFDKYSNQIIDVGGKILLGLVILIAGIWVIKILIKAISKAKMIKKMDATVRGFITNFIKVALYFLLFSSVAIVWGFPATTLITTIASAGIAISMALQGTLSNVAGGILILVTHPFKAGDVIEVTGHRGKVKSVTLIYTTIESANNEIITLPNSSLTNEKLINYSTNKTRRCVINVHVSYDSDIELVKKCLIDAVANSEMILKDPAPSVVLTEHGDSSLEFELRVWCKSEDYWDVRFNCIEETKKVLDANNIEIPYPKMDINIVNK